LTGIGLFLGAGASFESGMPLALDLSAEIRAWLTPEKIRQLNEVWRTQGTGHPDVVIDSLVESLLNPSMHYENVLGNLEVLYRRGSNFPQSYYHLYAWLVELVYRLLYYRHIKNEKFITSSPRYLEGIVGLARANSPLWIFSLNHDLIIECLALHYDVGVDCGFSGKKFLPLRDEQGSRLGNLPVQVARPF